VSWQPPSEDWQSALQQPEDWQKGLERPIPSTPPPSTAPPASTEPAPAEPPARPWQPAEHAYHSIGTTAPGAAAALALGIVGLWMWFLGPFAWYQGARARREIRASGGRLGGKTIATIGMTLGILTTVAMVLGIIGFGLFVNSLDLE
jgi:hypothetical protein